MNIPLPVDTGHPWQPEVNAVKDSRPIRLSEGEGSGQKGG